MPRGRPKKPQWGYQNGGWLETMELSESARAQLSAYHDSPKFIRQLECALAEYKFNRELLTTAPTPTEIKLALNAIATSSTQLAKQLHLLDSESFDLLCDQLCMRQGDAELIQRLKTDLQSLYVAVLMAERDLEIRGGRPKINAAKRFLASQVASILDHYGINVTKYEDGPWCRVLRILLSEADGVAPTEIRNIVRGIKLGKIE